MLIERRCQLICSTSATIFWRTYNKFELDYIEKLMQSTTLIYHTHKAYFAMVAAVFALVEFAEVISRHLPSL